MQKRRFEQVKPKLNDTVDLEMAQSSNAKSRSVLQKILPNKRRDSKKGGALRRKRSKRKEIKLEAFSVSENFDPETYIIPIQNRWTIERDHGRASDISINDERQLISNEDSVSKSSISQASTHTVTNGKIADHTLENRNHIKDQSIIPRKVSKKPSRKVKKGKVVNDDPYSLLKNLDGLNNIGYVPSHPMLKQRLPASETSYVNEEDREEDTPTSRLRDSWRVHIKQSNGPHSKSEIVNNDDENATRKEDIDQESKIENIVILHDKVTSMPGMVDKANEDFDELDIDGVELVAESDDYDYDDLNDQWSVGTPSLPSLSLSSSSDSINNEFDQSSQSDFSTLAYKRNKLPLTSSTVIEIDENDLEADLPSKVLSLQKSFQALVVAVEDQRKILLRKGEVSDRKEKNYKKQRTREGQLIDQRFTRLESHVITLARSVAHLSAELKSQNIIRQSMATLQKDIYELKARRANELSYLQERVRLVQTDKTSQKTIRKLRKFFGADPGHPLLCNLLEELGYEDYAENFHKAKIGIMELPYTSEEQLKGIGIPSGPRQRILENIKHLY